MRHNKNERHDYLFTLKLKLFKGEPMIIIDAYDAPKRYYGTGINGIDVEVRQGGKIIFERGQLYCGVNQWTVIDGDEAKELVLSLVSISIETHSAEQLEWTARNGESI